MLSKEKLESMIESAAGGLSVSTEDVRNAIEGDTSVISEIVLYAELLLCNDWETVSQIFPESKWSRILSIDSIRALFPRNLRDKYLPIRDSLLDSGKITDIKILEWKNSHHPFR